MIYLFVFFLTSGFVFIAEYQKGLHSIVRKILLLISILLPVLLAAFRNISVGTDLKVYGVNVFMASVRASNFSDLLYLYKWHRIEMGYLLLNYIISRFTDQLWIFLFIVYYIILRLVFSTFLFIKNNIEAKFSITFSILCYYFLFYNESLNLIRQSIAIAIVFFSYRYIIQNKRLKFALCIALAMQFHMTAILAVGIFVLYHFIVRNQNMQFVKISFIICVIGVFFVPNMLRIFLRFGFFNGKYSSRYFFSNSISIALTQFIIRIPFIFLLLYQANKKAEKQHNFLFFSLILMLDFVFASMRSVVSTLYRLSLYFSYFKPIIYYEITDYYGVHNKKKMKIAIILFLIILWFYQIVYQGNGETIPYQFMF